MNLPDLLLKLPERGVRLRRAAANMDLLSSIGPVYAWDHLVARQQVANSGDTVRDAVYRAIWQEAADLVQARLNDLGSGVLEIVRNGSKTKVWQQFVMLDDVVSLRLALDKVATSQALVDAGLPGPESLQYDKHDLSRAAAFLESSGFPCVVKPARGTGGGAGIVCGVRSVRELTRATLWASRVCTDLLIERQAVGEVYRFLFLHGELLDVLHTGPATVVGDGRSTIYQLIAAENARRLTARGSLGLSVVSVDPDCVATLERAGLSLRTIPAPQQTVVVKTATNDSRVEDNSTVMQDVSPALVDEVAGAARATGLELAGVDIITADVTRTLREVAGVIIEVNGGPALHRHYQVRDPHQARRVAVPILEDLLSRH